ncbi:AraC family transcriptional regulator [Mesorhizobium shangrilense]|uniref:AraC family transcriptional regulator n=1 Tax=Mesorhizobium shangrilense TaxID=460060 RepID=A0ABV2D6P7_9HYPH
MTIQWADRAPTSGQPFEEGPRTSCSRSWTGISVEVVDLHGRAGWHLEDLRSQQPRLTAVLEEIGGRVEMRLAPPCPAPARNSASQRPDGHLTFIPAGTPVWECAGRFRYIRRVVIDFDIPALTARFDCGLEFPSHFVPRLMFSDTRVQALAGLLADACASPHLDSRSYGDSLALAIVYNLFRPALAARQKRGGLAPAQLRRVTARMAESLFDPTSIEDLADMTGLSASYFSRAFKASTGMAPHRWYLTERVRRAQRALLETNDSLAEVALASGFADQSHFTRAFRTITGASPGAWRKSREA